MADDSESLLGGPLELPGEEPHISRPVNKPPQRRKISKKLLLIILVLLILAGAAFGIWKFLEKDAKQSISNQSKTKQAQPFQTQTTPRESDVPEVADTKNFQSDALGLELTYPDTWTVNEANGGVRVESPEFRYTTPDKGEVSGNFRIYIRKGARTADSKYIGRGVAIKPSEKLTYNQPTASQRKDTLVTQFGLDVPDNFAYFFVAGNFNLNKGDTLGPDYGKEPETFIVAGGYSAKELTDDMATNKISLDSYSQTNAYKQAIDIIKSLKLQ